jgi:hypothetical protein
MMTELTHNLPVWDEVKTAARGYEKDPEEK